MSPFEFIANSYLVSAAVAAASGLIIFAIIRRENSIRPDGLVNKQHVVAIVFAPLLTVLTCAAAAFGVATLRTLATQTPNVQEWAVAGGAALLTVIVWTLTAPGRQADETTGRRAARQPLNASLDDAATG